jgi:hypothetical protein
MLLRALQPEDAHDVTFLAQMLVEAVNWRPDRRRLAPEEVLADPHLARYIRGWGRHGDGGVIAEEYGGRVGACWYRLFSADEPGYGLSTNAPRNSGSRSSPISGDMVSAGPYLALRCPKRRPKASQPSV